MSTTSTEGNVSVLCSMSQTLETVPCVKTKVKGLTSLIAVFKLSKDILLVSILFSSSISLVITNVSSLDIEFVGG